MSGMKSQTTSVMKEDGWIEVTDQALTNTWPSLRIIVETEEQGEVDDANGDEQADKGEPI